MLVTKTHIKKNPRSTNDHKVLERIHSSGYIIAIKLLIVNGSRKFFVSKKETSFYNTFVPLERYLPIYSH